MNEERQARERHNTIAFWLNDEEKQLVEARIEVSGMLKGDFYRAAVLGQEIHLIGGRYKSDRLAKVLERLSNQIEKRDEAAYKELKTILKELLIVLKR